MAKERNISPHLGHQPDGQPPARVEEIRAHRVFVKLAKENDTQRWIYFNVALLTVAEKLPALRLRRRRRI